MTRLLLGLVVVRAHGFGGFTDADEDGVAADLDCNDGDPDVYPGARERPYDGVDQDCDGEDLCDVDGDGHLHPACLGDDCDDEDRRINPSEDDPLDDQEDRDCDGYDGKSFVAGGGGCRSVEVPGRAGIGGWVLAAVATLARRRARHIDPT